MNRRRLFVLCWGMLLCCVAHPPLPPPAMIAAAITHVKSGASKGAQSLQRFAIDSVCLASEGGAVRMSALDTVTDPAHVWLRKRNDAWRVVAGPGTGFSEEEILDADLSKELYRAHYNGTPQPNVRCTAYDHATSEFPIAGRYVRSAGNGASMTVTERSGGQVQVAGNVVAKSNHVGDVQQVTDLRWSMDGSLAAWVFVVTGDRPSCSLWINFAPNQLIVKQITPSCNGAGVSFAGTYVRQ